MGNSSAKTTATELKEDSEATIFCNPCRCISANNIDSTPNLFSEPTPQFKQRGKSKEQLVSITDIRHSKILSINELFECNIENLDLSSSDARQGIERYCLNYNEPPAQTHTEILSTYGNGDENIDDMFQDDNDTIGDICTWGRTEQNNSRCKVNRIVSVCDRDLKTPLESELVNTNFEEVKSDGEQTYRIEVNSLIDRTPNYDKDDCYYNGEYESKETSQFTALMDKFCDEKFRLNQVNAIAEDASSYENRSSKNFTNKSIKFDSAVGPKNKDLMINTGFSPQLYQNLGHTYDEFMKIHSFDSTMLISPGLPISADCQKKLMFSTQNNSKDLKSGEFEYQTVDKENMFNNRFMETSKVSFVITPDGKSIKSTGKEEIKSLSCYYNQDLPHIKVDTGLNINVSGCHMSPQDNESIYINMELLQTDLWFTGFGMTIRELCDPNDKIVFEGELYKYKPGIDTMYITRWCQLTKNVIRIYKNQMAAKGFSGKPILALPLRIFKGIKKSKFVVPEKGKNIKLIKTLNKNQFELCYKKEVLDMIMLNFLQSKVIENDENINTNNNEELDINTKLTILKGNLTSNESFKINATMETLNNSCSWSNREGEWFCAEKRLMFSSQRSRDAEDWIKNYKRYL